MNPCFDDPNLTPEDLWRAAEPFRFAILRSYAGITAPIFATDDADEVARQWNALAGSPADGVAYELRDYGKDNQ